MPLSIATLLKLESFRIKRIFRRPIIAFHGRLFSSWPWNLQFAVSKWAHRAASSQKGWFTLHCRWWWWRAHHCLVLLAIRVDLRLFYSSLVQTEKKIILIFRSVLGFHFIYICMYIPRILNIWYLYIFVSWPKVINFIHNMYLNFARYF